MAQPHTESSQVIRIAPLGAQLAGASTTAILKAHQLEVVRVVLPAGKTLAQHRVPGEITLQCIEGAVQLRTEGAVQELRAGDFVHLQGGAHHELQGLEDASLLLTICLAAGAGKGC